MLTINILIILVLALTLLEVERLKRLLPVFSIFIKLFPYLLSVATFNYCFFALFNSSDILVRIVAIANLPFFLVYLILHDFINESLKFREVDFCNQRISSLT